MEDKQTYFDLCKEENYLFALFLLVLRGVMLVNHWYINEIIDSWVSHLIFLLLPSFMSGWKEENKNNVLYEEQVWLTLILRHSSSESNSRNQALWRIWEGAGAAVVRLVTRASSLPERLAWGLAGVLTVHPTTKFSVMSFVISWELVHSATALGYSTILLGR